MGRLRTAWSLKSGFTNQWANVVRHEIWFMSIPKQEPYFYLCTVYLISMIQQLLGVAVKSCFLTFCRVRLGGKGSWYGSVHAFRIGDSSLMTPYFQTNIGEHRSQTICWSCCRQTKGILIKLRIAKIVFLTCTFLIRTDSGSEVKIPLGVHKKTWCKHTDLGNHSSNDRHCVKERDCSICRNF